MNDNIWIVWCCDNWEFSPNLTRKEVKMTQMTISGIEKTIKDANNNRCDFCDWLNFGLFMDQVLLGSNRNTNMSNIIVFGIYRNEEEAQQTRQNVLNNILLNS